MPPPLIEVARSHGIRLPEADLWLDPRIGSRRAFISHAHSDHVARHELTFCTEATWRLIQARNGRRRTGEVRVLPLREPFAWEGWEMRLLPAGHIPGSAMLHLTRLDDGATLLYTGDFKLRAGLSAEPCELLPADTLIMETTFGLPRHRFPPRVQIAERMLGFVADVLKSGGIPVLLGWSLGKAQEILCLLAHAGHPVMVHPSVAEMTRAAAPLPSPVPEFRLFDSAAAAGHVLVFPPSAERAALLREMPGCRTALLSGWALEPRARYQYRVDEAIPLSDHADHAELIETVERVRPRQVWTVHGSTAEFAADLRSRGWAAWSLEEDDQMELPLSEP